MTPAVWDETGHPERRRISEDLFPLIFTAATFFGSASTKCEKLSADLADLERFMTKVNAISFSNRAYMRMVPVVGLEPTRGLLPNGF